MSLQTVEKIVSALIKFLFVALVMVIFWGGMLLEANKKPIEEQNAFFKEQRELYQAATQAVVVNTKLPKPWPPVMNAAYPDFELIDQDGVRFNLSDLLGRVIVIDYIDMSSGVSQTQSGARTVGAYGSADYEDPTAYVFAELLKKETNGALTLPNPKLLELKIIIYGEGGAQGSRDDAESWARHFGFKKENNVLVVVPVKDLRDPLTDQSIGGYQLLDTNMRLRADSSGVAPKHHLRLTLMPLVPNLLK